MLIFISKKTKITVFKTSAYYLKITIQNPKVLLVNLMCCF